MTCERHPTRLSSSKGTTADRSSPVFPIALVQCDQTWLEACCVLDAIVWPGNDSNMASVRFEGHPAGSGIPGGMGGGLVSPDGWVHEEFVGLGLAEQIRDVVESRKCKRILRDE